MSEERTADVARNDEKTSSDQSTSTPKPPPATKDKRWQLFYRARLELREEQSRPQEIEGVH